MLTGIAIGCFENLGQAADIMVHEAAVYSPDEETSPVYGYL